MSNDGEKKCFKFQASTKAKTVKVAKKDEYAVEITWEIDNFLAQPSKVGEKVSVEWDIHEKYLKFEMRVYPGGNLSDSTGFVSTFICNKSQRNLTFTCRKGGVMKDGKEIMLVKDETQRVADKEGNTASWGWLKFLKRSEIEENPEKYLENGALVLKLHYDIEEDFEDENEYLNTAVTDVAKDIKDAFMVGGVDGLTNTDVTLICNDGEIKCHKFMLSSRSTVFNGYFKKENNTEENNNNTVKIEDSTLDSVKEMVKFIYTNKFREDYENVGQLLHLAQKYNIESLKIMTESFLCTKISVKTVAELLGMGKTYMADKLKDMSMKFIMRNPEKVTEMEGWSDLTKSYPEVIAEMFAQMRPLTD